MPNAVRDTTDVARHFEALGLRTELLQDAGRATTLAELEKFKRTARGENLAVFYYAGHGASWDKDTYIVPVDAELGTPEAVRALVPVTAVSEAVGGATNKFLAFDNCRNNPADGWRQRAASDLARINSASLAEAALHGPNTLMVFSTAPGHVALDGPAGQNSPFAAALLRQLATQSVDLTSMPAKLRRDLLIATEGQQVLWDVNTFTGPLTIGKLGSRQQSSASGRLEAATSPVVDRGRIVELPHAYEFARQKNLPLPPGLVAIRSASGSPHDSKCGAFQYSNRVFVGRQGSQLIGQSIEPFILVFISTAGADIARIAISGRYHASEEGPVWRLLNARLSGDRMEWVDNRNGHSASDQMRWTDPNTGTFAGNPPQYGGFFTPFNGRFTRLD